MTARSLPTKIDDDYQTRCVNLMGNKGRGEERRQSKPVIMRRRQLPRQPCSKKNGDNDSTRSVVPGALKGEEGRGINGAAHRAMTRVDQPGGNR